MIFALCGTGDARELAVRIQQSGFKILTSVVTESAAASLRAAGLPVRVGRLDKQDIAALIRREQVRAVVDASHPFAEEAHRNAIAAATATGIPYIRYERVFLDYGDAPGLTVVASYEEAAAEARKSTGSVMLTTGSKTLATFAKVLLEDPDIRLVVRLLPRRENIEKCEELGIASNNIIALYGPFSTELNEALYRQYGIRTVVTKESGGPGAVDEKIAAALKLGIRVIVIARPQIEFGAVFTDCQGVIGYLNEAAGFPNIPRSYE